MDSTEFHIGPEDFPKVAKNYRIGTLIRVYDTHRLSTDEDYFVIGENRQLFDARNYENGPVDPNFVLDRKNAEEGWCIEGYSLDVFPDEVLKDFFKRGVFC